MEEGGSSPVGGAGDKPPSWAPPSSVAVLGGGLSRWLGWCRHCGAGAHLTSTPLPVAYQGRRCKWTFHFGEAAQLSK